MTEAFAAASGEVRRLIAEVGVASPEVERALLGLQEREREKLRITVRLHAIKRRQRDADERARDFVGSSERAGDGEARRLVRELEACVSAINETMEELAEEEEMARERDG